VTVDAPAEELTPEERRALFRVVRGAPTDEEVAALTVVLAAAASGGGDEPAAAGHDPWSDPASRFRTPLAAGPGAWLRTYRPR
jgi:hypothetical protein